SVAVLLHHEQRSMCGQKALYFLAERKPADSHVVDVYALLRKARPRLAHGPVAAAERDDRRFQARLLLDDRSRHQPSCGQPLLAQAVDDDLVLLRIFGVAAVLVVSRAARKVGAFRADTRQRALRNAVVVVIVVAPELLDVRELLRVE